MNVLLVIKIFEEHTNMKYTYFIIVRVFNKFRNDLNEAYNIY